MKNIADEIVEIRKVALQSIYPIRPANEGTKADEHFLFKAKRTDAGRELPPYYLVYFLLVDLLGFRNLGQFEKIAWSIPIDFEGRAFLIEHRKFGVGVFVHDPSTEETAAQKIVALIKKGVRVAEPFFDHLADEAVRDSKLNVKNNSIELFGRFVFFLEEYRWLVSEAKNRSSERVVENIDSIGISATSVHFPSFELMHRARWLALAAIDAFFSWTEHVFIHISILMGNVKTGLEVADLTESEWAVKYKQAIGLNDLSAKDFYDKLTIIRRQFRNFIAHGAFGKRREAFSFHSGAGAVPVLLPHRTERNRFTLTDDQAFDDGTAIKVINDFIEYLWSGEREPTKIYIQDNGLPAIMTMAADGTYTDAIKSVEGITQLAGVLNYQIDQAANMDW